MAYAKGDLVKVVNNDISEHHIPVGTEIQIEEVGGVICFLYWDRIIWGLYKSELEPVQRVGDMEIIEGSALNLIDTTTNACQGYMNKPQEKITPSTESQRETSTIGGSLDMVLKSTVAPRLSRSSSHTAASYRKSTKSKKKSKR